MGGQKNDSALRAQEAQYRYNRDQARKQARQGVYDTYQRLEDYARGANQQLATGAATLGKLGALEYGANNDLIGGFSDVSRPTTDIQEITGFNPEEYNQQVADFESRVEQAKQAVLDAGGRLHHSPFDSDDSEPNIEARQARREYDRLVKEQESFLEESREKRDNFNRLQGDIQKARGQTGNIDINTPAALRKATGSNLLNLSRGRSQMFRDRDKILSMGLQASHNALEAGQHYQDQADFTAAAADAQERQMKRQRIFQGITGALGLIGGGLITGGAAGLIGGSVFQGAMGNIGIGSGISFMTGGAGSLGGSFI